MPDPFQNARPYFDVSFPSSGDNFSIANFKNAFRALGFLDFIPGMPRAHNPPDMRIMVRGRDASAYFNPAYYGDADSRIPMGSGDTPVLTAPVSNPRIDVVYVNASGDIRVVFGTEAASPSIPSIAPSGDSIMPIAAIWHRVGETKIVNFEDKDSNSGDGYIYKDLRPWLTIPRASAGGATLGVTAALSVTGDNTAGTLSTAIKSDHHHQGVHAIRKVGSAEMFGDVEFAGPIVQGGNRLTVSGDGLGYARQTRIVPLTDAATINIEASLGNLFRVTLGGNRTLANPTNPIAGQKMIFEIKQDGTGNRTISLGNKFRVPSGIGAITLSTGAGSGDRLGVVYNEADDKFDVVAFVKGF